MNRAILGIVGTMLLVMVLAPFDPLWGATGIHGGSETSRVSVASDGTEGNGLSGAQSISNDGRFVAFASGATNLVSGDSNNVSDIFLHDRNTSTTSRISRATDGTQSNGASTLPSISGDGHYVAFHSDATNLVSGDTNASTDVFRHDLNSGSTIRIATVISGTQGNDDSFFPKLSANGRYMVFFSSASNLVVSDTNNAADVFYIDLNAFDLLRVSKASDGTQANSISFFPAISGDGSVVAYESFASNLVTGDTNGTTDVFVHVIATGVTSRISVASDGTQGNGASYHPFLSGDGRYVAFASNATNLVTGDTNGFADNFLHDRNTGITTRISVATDGTQGNGDSLDVTLSSNGKFAAFHSFATNFVISDTNAAQDVFFRDFQSLITSRISVSNKGTQANGFSTFAIISGDGRFISYESEATNLITGDTNNHRDVFVSSNTAIATPTPSSQRLYLPVIRRG